MIGKTNSQTGGAVKGEKLNISLGSNQADKSDLIGAIISVSHPGGTTNYTWEGYELTVNVPPYVEYTVSYSNIVGYKTPASFSSTAVPDNSRTLTPIYESTVVTVMMEDNQPSLDDVASATATVYAEGIEPTVLHAGESVKVPSGSTCSLIWGNLEDYKTPASQSFTASGSEVTKSGVYMTEVVRVMLSADNGESLDGASVTINGKTHFWAGEEIVQKVAFGVEYSITSGFFGGFVVPSVQSFTANSESRQISLVYP